MVSLLKSLSPPAYLDLQNGAGHHEVNGYTQHINDRGDEWQCLMVPLAPTELSHHPDFPVPTMYKAVTGQAAGVHSVSFVGAGTNRVGKIHLLPLNFNQFQVRVKQDAPLEKFGAQAPCQPAQFL
jgi:hypothetical protein